jgi:polysaccharide pyruvyl transferase CsaB
VPHSRNKKTKPERQGVLICGAYGFGNAGDNAILESIVGELRTIDPELEITVLSRDPASARESLGVGALHHFDFIRVFFAMRKTKLYISGGGSLIQNVTSRRSLWYYLFSIYSAKKLGNTVMMYGCGIGPIVDPRDTGLLRSVLNGCVDAITLREDYSRGELERFGVTQPNITVTCDPVLGLPPIEPGQADEFMSRVGLDPEGEYVCFSVREWEGFSRHAQAFAEAADFVASKGFTPVFALLNGSEDLGATVQVLTQMTTRSKLAIIDDGALAVGVFSKMKAVVSMRLHGLIFAACAGVPLIGVSYDPKVTAFLDSIGENLCVPLGQLSKELLCDMLSGALENGLSEEHRQVISRLRDAERQNLEIAKQLLED